ncbi:MAG: GAF domain-containing protein [Acidobacteriota bacterium]|nr:GAF domain-containing protein [Acidobacteriota bacterium]
MPARLTIYLPDRPARVVELADGRDHVIGRDEACDVVVADDRVSRRHAILRAAGEGWSLTDMGSKNGTLVDGMPATGVPLPRRGWLSLGGLLASFERLSAAESMAQSAERLARWQTSIELRNRFSAAGSLAGLLQGVLDSVLQLAGADRGFLLLAGAGGELDVAATAGLESSDLAAPDFSGSIGAVERAIATGRTVATSDALAEGGLRSRVSVLSGGIRSLVCLPLIASERLIGAAYADSRRVGSGYTDLDVEILEALAAHAALAIAVTKMDEELQGLLAAVAQRLDLSGESRASLISELERARQRARVPLESATRLPGGVEVRRQASSWRILVEQNRGHLKVTR